MTTAGPLVSFSLRQAGAELKVDNLALPINLTLPSSLGNVGSRPSLASSRAGSVYSVECDAYSVGQPSQQDATLLLEQLLKTNDGSTRSEVAELRAALRGVGCDKALECNFWSESTATWSGENCRTTGVSEAGVGCSCDHLTDFINVVVPTSWDEFATYAVNGESRSLIPCYRPPYLWPTNIYPMQGFPKRTPLLSYDMPCAGFVVNTFTWEEAMACLASPSWSMVHMITAVRAAFSGRYITSSIDTCTYDHDPAYIPSRPLRR